MSLLKFLWFRTSFRYCVLIEGEESKQTNLILPTFLAGSRAAGYEKSSGYDSSGEQLIFLEGCTYGEKGSGRMVVRSTHGEPGRLVVYIICNNTCTKYPPGEHRCIGAVYI